MVQFGFGPFPLTLSEKPVFFALGCANASLILTRELSHDALAHLLLADSFLFSSKHY